MTPYDLAKRLIGVAEKEGPDSDPFVLKMLKLDNPWVIDDETPWCSAFVNYVCFSLGYERTKNLAARSWLAVGEPRFLYEAEPGTDVAIIKRGAEPQPGPTVLKASGHVGFYAGRTNSSILILGGNQGNEVSIKPFPVEKLLGIRRLRRVEA